MIDDAAIREALLAVLAGGPIPADAIKRQGEAFTPPAEGPHLRATLIWQRKGRTGFALTEAKGMLQILVYAPQGTPAGAVEALAREIGELFEAHVDGPQLAGLIRVTDVVTLTTADYGDQGEGGAVTPWIVTPLQVDFRLELIPAGLV